MNLLKNQSTFNYFTDFLFPRLQLRYFARSIKSSLMMQLQNVERPTFELVNEDATRRTCPVALDHSGDEYDGLAYAPDSLVINCVGIKLPCRRDLATQRQLYFCPRKTLNRMIVNRSSNLGKCISSSSLLVVDGVQ